MIHRFQLSMDAESIRKRMHSRNNPVYKLTKELCGGDQTRITQAQTQLAFRLMDILPGLVAGLAEHVVLENEQIEFARQQQKDFHS